MTLFRRGFDGFVLTALAAFVISFSTEALAQVNRPGRVPQPRPTVSPTPVQSRDLPVVVSRAEDYNEDGGGVDTLGEAAEPKTGAVNPSKTIKNLQERIKQLEAGRRPDPDEKEKRLLLNLEILTKAEQRSESLRKQFFEMIEKENSIQTRLDAIENEIRPEAIERSVAGIGSFRPEELRAARRRNLESERNNLQNLLTEVQRHKSNLDLNIQKADVLVERLRVKLEADIDAALSDEAGKQP